VGDYQIVPLVLRDEEDMIGIKQTRVLTSRGLADAKPEDRAGVYSQYGHEWRSARALPPPIAPTSITCILVMG
jgi:hypothetical protein